MARYAFYDDDLRQQFLEKIAKYNYSFELKEANDEFLVNISDSLDFDEELELEEIYNKLLSDGLDLWAEAGGTGVETNSAGVRVQLSDGQVCQIRLDTSVMNKLLGCISPQELEDLVQQIARATENPSDVPLCEML